MNRVPKAAERAATLLGLATGAVLLAATAAQAAPAAAERSAQPSPSAATLQSGTTAPDGETGNPRLRIDVTDEWNTIASRPLPPGQQL
ncbi:hypothetical protein AB0F71_16990 [Kitasatospora sp. NPDC028055]|uniref:hypothetical protein n=1 Tax=Kitasatospora sp. NPDC028055 TaxID=3155653 RepID=UPI0033F618C8